MTLRTSDKRRVAIVSPYFPPSTLAGVHRARHLAKHLPTWGWEPTILCVDERFHEQNLDADLARLVPEGRDIRRVGAIPTALARRFGLGDIGLRGYLQLRAALHDLLSAEPVDAVLITGSPFYPMLMAPEIKRRFGVPVVLDFQDPWVSRWGATQSVLSKSGVVHQLAKTLEPLALRGASFVTSVSDPQNAEMADRYPWWDRTQMAAVPIGGDPEDFEALRASGPRVSTDAEAGGRIRFSYVGTYMPRTEVVMRALFRGFRRLRTTNPDLAARISFEFVGTSNQAVAAPAKLVTPIAEAEGVADAITERPARAPFLEALSLLAASDAVLLIGSDEPHYTASKIYPALMSGRPLLSIFHTASSSNRILSEAGGGVCLSFESPSELEALEDSIGDAIARLATSPQSVGQVDARSYEAFTANSIAGRYAAIFERLTGPGL